jgi:uncharacterized protein (TIGR03067 family)
MVAVDSHPSRADLEAFALGRLHDDTDAAVEEHVNRCSSCQLVLDQVPGDTLVALLRSAASVSDTIKALQGAPTMADTPAEGPAVAPSAVDLPAALIGHPRYEPTRLLGTGGMGTVWLAQHRVMGRQVAVKVIRPEFVAKPGAAERFHRETQAAARLHHPNIVTAFDAENAGESHLLAMEYVEGVNLADLLRQRGPLPVTEACDAIRQAALGLEHACACGLIHRDLKPHNLMRTADGTVKILDFGLAVLTDVNRVGDGLTAENVVLGTPDYIAPEQAEDSRAADIRSDIYSLGCTLYHLLTGQVPFPGDSVLRKLDAHRQREPKPIRTIRPEVPIELAAIVARMMAKSPADRYQTPAEVAAALAPFAAGTTPARKRRRTWVAVAAAMLFTGLIAAAGVVFYIKTDNGTIEIRTDDENVKILAERNGKQVTILDPKSKQTWVVDTGEWTVRLDSNPDGLKIEMPDKFTLKRGDKQVVTIKRVKGPDPVAVEEKVGEVRRFVGFPTGYWVTRAEFTPDGRRVVASSALTRIWNVASGESVAVMGNPKPMGWGLALAPDGKTAYQSTDDGVVHVYDLEKSKEVGRLDAPGRGPSLVELSADGKRILITVLHVWKYRLCQVPGGKELAQIEGNGPAVLSPDGTRVAVFRDKRIVLWDVTSGKQGGGFDTNLEGNGVAAFRFTPDGRSLVAAGSGAQRNVVRIWDVATGKERFSINVPDVAADTILRLGVSPDGRRVLTGTDPRWPATNPPIILWDVETAKEIRRFSGPENGVFALVFSPDGRSAVVTGADGTVRLLRLPGNLADKAGWPRAFAPPQPTITRDGVSADQGGWRIDAQGARTVRLFEVPDPGIENGVLTYRARMKSDKLQGKAYLEMWCRLPGKGEFFSKGLLSPVTGTTDWASYETPFFLKRGERPDLLKLNVVLEGKGTLWIKDVQVNFKANARQDKSPPRAQADQERILGTWKAVAAEVQGAAIPDVILKTVAPTLTFTRDKLTWKADPASPFGKLNFEGIYHLDTAKSPKTIDLVYLGRVRKTLLGIYTLDGDILKLCVSVDPDRAEDRATEFATKPGSLRGIVTLKRQFPEKP